MDASSYPVPPRSDNADVLHGESIADPFRPLEDPDADATSEWVRDQNSLTERFLAEVPARSAIRARIEELWDYPKAGVPVRRGSRWFQMRNSGLQAQSVLWVADGPDAEGRPLIDPNGFSSDGTVSLTSLGISDAGDRVAYATSGAGSDWMTWHVRDVGSGQDLADQLEWSKFSGAAWSRDGSGFFYGAVEQPPVGEELTAQTTAPRILFHRLGDEQDRDETVYEVPAGSDWFPTAEVTPDGRWLVITIERGTGRDTTVLLRDLDSDDRGLRPLAGEFEARDLVVWADGEEFVLFTDRGAERGRLVRGAPGRPTGWRDVIPEADDTLVEAHVYGGRLVCHYLRDAHSVLTVHDLTGAFEREVPLPGMVSLLPGPTGASVEGAHDSPLIHFQVVSFIESGAVWAHDLRTGETTLIRPSGAGFDPSAYTTVQVFVTSNDGTRVPMFVTQPGDGRAGAARRPVLLYGYGGFAIPLTPTFSVTFAAWLDRGGALAVANLRGGGEYGRQWHDAGRLGEKQNVFDDFAACAAWLSDQEWCGPGRVAITGGSNGGLLVGASITQRPDLFGAAVADVGVFDMLRFHRFTIGWAWKADYGDPDDPEAYRWLRAYSPLHNVRPGTCYPPTLIMTGDHDDRVVPAHSYKFAATLQEAQTCANPVLLRVSTSAGHGLGKPTSKLIDEAADRLAFLEHVLPRT